ncbi:MAG: DUF805 domain-containing protein [Bdellovibrionales bacterium]
MHPILETYKDTLLTKYACFEGRASRREFWTLSLITAAITFAINILSSVLHAPALLLLSLLVILGTFIPLLAVSIRRLHDTDRSGWWLLTNMIPFIGGIILLIFYLLPGTEGPNRFGPDPYGNPATIEQIED